MNRPPRWISPRRGFFLPALCHNVSMASRILDHRTKPLINVTRALLRGMRAHVSYAIEADTGVTEDRTPTISLTQNIDQFQKPYLDSEQDRRRFPDLPMLIFSMPNARKSPGVYQNQSALIDLAEPEAEPTQGRIARPPVYYDLVYQFVLAASDNLMLADLMNSMVMTLEDPLAELVVRSPENNTEACYEPVFTDPPQAAELTGSDDGLFRAYGEIVIPGVEFQFYRWNTEHTVREFIIDPYSLRVQKPETGQPTGG